MWTILFNKIKFLLFHLNQFFISFATIIVLSNLWSEQSVYTLGQLFYIENVCCRGEISDQLPLNEVFTTVGQPQLKNSPTPNIKVVEASIPSLVFMSLKKAPLWLVEETDARLASGCCTVEYKQLNICSKSVQVCSAWSRPVCRGLKYESLLC